MSLQVWLPLIQDAHNQGLCGDTLTTSGVTFADGGKLGAKYLSGGTITIPATVSNKIFNKNDMSFAFWLYPIGTSSSGAIMGQSSMGAGNNRMYTIFQYSTPNDLHLSWQDETANNTTFLGIINTGFFPADTWTHCCITYNGSTALVYKNGVLYSTHSGTSNRTAFNYDFPIMGSSIRKLNDVRIYNHCLSPKEVKEISKGLILHYKLDGKYESTINLQSNGRMSTSSCFNGATSKYGFGTNTDIYYEDGNFQGRDCVKFKMGTAGNAAHPYTNIAYSPAINGYKTISFDYYPTIMPQLVFYSYNGNSPCTYSWNVDGNKGSSSTATTNITVPVVLNKWNHVELTLYNTGTIADGWNYFQIGNANHTSTTTDYWLFSNVQIEEKDHATPFTIGTRTYNIEYDCSGYRNNGQFYSYDSNGTIEESINTPRYNRSMYINSSNNITNTASGTKYLYGNCSLINPNNLTISFWCKPIAGYGGNTAQGQFCTTNTVFGPDAGVDYQVSAMNHRDTGIDINNSAANTHLRLSVDFTANEWHCYSFTYDGKTARAYKDGIQTATTAFNSNMSLGSFIGIILGFSKAGGVWRSNKSYYSDLKVYATALSAEDVKELYQTSASIDNKGNIYAYELEEG